MEVLKFVRGMFLLSIALQPLAASDGLVCYSFPVGGPPPGALSEDLEAHYQRQFDFVQKQGADMQTWQDTAMFAFIVKFHGLDYGNSIPDPKDGSVPDPKPVDTLSPRAFKDWAQVLFTQYAIFDYNDPKSRLDAPIEPNDTFAGLATRATLLGISKECFTGVVEPGGPNGPINLIKTVRKSVVPGKENRGTAYNIAGRKNTANAPQSSSVLFKK
jgi:hypothetical protein